MTLFEGVRSALTSLLANKLRSFLTMLGVIIGVAAVIVVVAIGEGLKADVMQRIQGLGTNLLMISPSSRSGRHGPVVRRGRLTDDDWEAIESKVTNVSAIAPIVQGSVTVKYRNRTHASRVLGSTPDIMTTQNLTLAAGRFFTTSEERSRARVVVLGSTVVEEIFYGRVLLEETVRIKGVPFRVIGVFEEKGGSWGSPDDQVYVPLSTARQRLLGRSTLSTIYVSAASTKVVAEVEESLTQVLRRQHRVRNEEDDFRIRSQEEILTTMSETSAMLTRFLAGIALVSLLVGGVGIMNIMLVSVAERTREIGIRKAVGARRRDIQTQFLIESTALSVIGGIIGGIIGIGISKLVGSALGWTTVVPLWAILVAFLFAAAVGVFFGYYPSRKAALLDPIECLRYE